jgi:hypothetical protein
MGLQQWANRFGITQIPSITIFSFCPGSFYRFGFLLPLIPRDIPHIFIHDTNVLYLGIHHVQARILLALMAEDRTTSPISTFVAKKEDDEWILFLLS